MFIFSTSVLIRHQLDIYVSLRQLLSCIGVFFCSRHANQD